MTKPYYAVIFTSKHSSNVSGYAEMAKKMIDLAQSQKGFLGVESARENLGITVSYWQTIEDIANWKANSEHLLAQELGKRMWYKWYKVRICKVEREYEFNTSTSDLC